MKTKNNVIVKNAYINANREMDEFKSFRWAMVKDDGLPAHWEVRKSRDIRWLKFDGMKVAVALKDKGLQSYLFKAIESIVFTDDDGNRGDLIDFIEEVNQGIYLSFCVADDFGQYEVEMILHVDGVARKMRGESLPNYLIIDWWQIGAPAIR